MLIFYGLSRNLSYELEVIEAQFLGGLFGSGTEKKKILHFVTQLATFCKLVWKIVSLDFKHLVHYKTMFLTNDIIMRIFLCMNYRIQGHPRIIVLRVTSQASRRDRNCFGRPLSNKSFMDIFDDRKATLGWNKIYLC